MPLQLICDFNEFYPNKRTFTIPIDILPDITELTNMVKNILFDWLPNLPSNSAVQLYSDPTDNLTIQVTVKHCKNKPYAVQTKWTTAEQLINMVQPGDKIEMKGSISGGLSLYSHFAVYTGKGCDGVPYDHDITHLAPPADCFDSELALNSKYSACIQSDNLISYAKIRECRVNNLRDLKAKPRSGIQVATHANSSRDSGVGQYSLLKNNCEHFANNCRYGEPVSDQVDKAIIAVGIGTTVAGILAVAASALLTRFVLGPRRENRDD